MKKKMGRPEIPVSIAQFEKLCSFQCSKLEIASWFECSEDKIERWVKKTYGMTFAAVFAQKRAKGLVSLRHRQYSKALEGSVPMLIFLGKNYLGQSDKVEVQSDERLEFTLPEFLSHDKKPEAS